MLVEMLHILTSPLPPQKKTQYVEQQLCVELKCRAGRGPLCELDGSGGRSEQHWTIYFGSGEETEERCETKRLRCGGEKWPLVSEFLC